MSLQKTFKLSAVAIALTTVSAGAFADLTINGTTFPVLVTNLAVSIDGLPAGNTVTASVDGTGVNVNTQLGSSSNVGGVGGGTVTLPTTGTANSVTNVPYDTNYSRTETQQQETQIYTPQKLEFTSAKKNGIANQTISRTADVSYDNNGDLSGLNNIVQTNDTGWVFDNASATTLVAESITLGKKTTGADNALTITKTDASGSETTTEVSASGISTDQIKLAGQDLATTIANGDAATLASANLYTDGQVANEAATRASVDTQLQANIDAEAVTRAAADTALNTRVDQEVADRIAGDQAIRADIAAKVTTNELEVNGSSTFNGAVTVNNVKSTTTIDQLGTPATTPEFGADVDGDGRPDTLIQTKEQTDAVTVNSQSQVYNENNLTFSSKVEKGTLTTTDQYTADIAYDVNGVATYGPNTANGQSLTSDLEKIAEDTIIVGKETVNSKTALTIRSKDANGESSTVVTSKNITTGNVSASTITLDGQDLATTIANGDIATLASANATTASTAATLRGEAAAESVRVNTAIVDGDTATLVSANAYTNTQVANVNSRVNQLNSRVDDVEKTSYRGIAIALAAQQQIPNIGAGQFAVFGGVGHYEGESAGALGVASVFADGRTSVSAALGFAGGSEVGGRVGVSYVFGGK